MAESTILPVRTSSDTNTSNDVNALSSRAIDKQGTDQLSSLAENVAPASGELFLMQNTAGKLEKVDTDNMPGGEFTSKLRVRMSTQQSVSTGSWTTIQFLTEDYDIDNEWNTGTYRFTPAVTGYYSIKCMARLDLVSDTKGFLLRCYKNGSTQIGRSDEYSAVNGGTLSRSIVMDVYMLNTDYIVFQAFHNEGIAINLEGQAQETQLSIHRIG